MDMRIVTICLPPSNTPAMGV